MADEEGFVRRWSRRKSEARAPATRPEPEPAAPGVSESSPAGVESLPPAPVASEPEAAAVPEAVDLAALPAVESLTYASDFTVFLRPGVPAELRRRALQQLWRSDPVLANLDGLVEYGEDYSKIGMVEEVVRTAYRVGRGMLDRLEAAAEAEAEGAPADEATAARPAAAEARASADAPPAGADGDEPAVPASSPSLPETA